MLGLRALLLEVLDALGHQLLVGTEARLLRLALGRDAGRNVAARISQLVLG